MSEPNKKPHIRIHSGVKATCGWCMFYQGDDCRDVEMIGKSLDCAHPVNVCYELISGTIPGVPNGNV